MSEPYDRNRDPTLVGGNGGYGYEPLSQVPSTPEQDARMWKKAFEMERDTTIQLRVQIETLKRERDQWRRAAGSL